jgi:hypothetical protein
VRWLAVLISVALLAFALPASATAHGGKPSASGDIPAQALAVQALAMLDANMGATDARDRVQAALRAKDQTDVRVGRVRAADAALSRNDTTTARRELEAAFNTDDQHLIGTSFTSSGDARIVAAILGTILVASALLLLLWQTRSSATTVHDDRPAGPREGSV